MTISIWWLIGLSHIILAAIIAIIWFAITSKLIKQKNKDLKNIVKQTILDYQTLANSIELSIHSQTQENSTLQEDSTLIETTEITQSTAQLHTSYNNIIFLQKQGLEKYPNWSDTTEPNHENYAQLKTYIELHLTQLLLEDNMDTAAQQWHAFLENHINQVLEYKTSQEAQKEALEKSHQLWIEKKNQIQSSFDSLVSLAQKTNNTSEIHETLNQLYNDFIAIINTVPSIEETQQDAFLKMESVSHSTNTTNSDDINALIEQADSIQNQSAEHENKTNVNITPDDVAVFLDETPKDTENEDEITSHLEAEHLSSIIDEIESNNIPLSDVSTDASEEQLLLNPMTDDEISPDNILPLSQHDLDQDDDDLELPPTAIQEFEAEETTPKNLNTLTPSAPQISEENDDDMFNDLLTTMDEVIEEKNQPTSNQNSAQDQQMN